MKKHTIRYNRWLAAALSASVIGTVSLGLGMAPALAETPQASQAAQSVRGLPDFVSLVEEVGPSVVSIRTTERVRVRRYGGGLDDDDMQEFFRRFFGVPMPGMPHADPRSESPQPPVEREVPRGVGSGFIISSDGYIMTNAHVVDGADEVFVGLNDQQEYKAKVIGMDKRTDIAVVKIDAKNLPAVRIGNVDDLKVGQWVIAIGSPFDLENTVTAGIVSAKYRDTGDYLPFIQTDVAVNPGNSGGPLINMSGEVVGINSQIYSRSGGFMGISFAIPIDEAMRIGDQLRSTGHVTRGRIGVRIDRVRRDVAESIGLDRPRGALVASVEPDSPADKAGIEAGDIILEFDGKEIEKVSDLPRLVGSTKPDTKTTITVFRRGKDRKLDITVGLMKPEETKASARSSGSSGEPSELPSGAVQALGLTVANMTDAERREANAPRGVQVEEVEGAAAIAGLQPGDIILNVGNTEINNVDDFRAAVKEADPSKSINMLVQRDDLVQFVLIPRSQR